MHPALRKGPLFYKKHPHFPLSFTKSTPQFTTFLQKNTPSPIFHFFTKKHPPHFIFCIRAWPVFEAAAGSSTCATKVHSQMVMKTTLRLSPSKTLRCPWILRALTSLNSVIMTNALKMMVKCCVGAECRPASRPLSMSNSWSPAAHKHAGVSSRRRTRATRASRAYRAWWLHTVAAKFRQTHSASRLAWSEGWRPPGAQSVLFFRRPRCEGWPHHGRTFSIYLCPLSFGLTLPRLHTARRSV